MLDGLNEIISGIRHLYGSLLDGLNSDISGTRSGHVGLSDGANDGIRIQPVEGAKVTLGLSDGANDSLRFGPFCLLRLADGSGESGLSITPKKAAGLSLVLGNGNESVTITPFHPARVSVVFEDGDNDGLGITPRPPVIFSLVLPDEPTDLSITPWVPQDVTPGTPWVEITYGFNLFINNRTLTPLQVAYPFQSMAAIGDAVYGVSDDGVYLVSGQDIDGANLGAYFEFWIDLGVRGRLRYVYIGGDFTENIVLNLTSDENITRSYTPAPRLSNKESSFKFSIRRDNGQGRYWKLRFTNADGGLMSVDDVSILPLLKAVR